MMNGALYFISALDHQKVRTGPGLLRTTVAASFCYIAEIAVSANISALVALEDAPSRGWCGLWMLVAGLEVNSVPKRDNAMLFVCLEA